MFILTLLLPLFGTALGSAAVYFNQNKDIEYEKNINAFTGGIVLSASIWSLLLPALSYSNKSYLDLILSVIGLIAGYLFVIRIEDKYEQLGKGAEKIRYKTDKNNLIQTMAIILHNIPEGVAVGAILSSYQSSGNISDLYNAFTLSLGISVQNIPEGSVISVPAYSQGNGKHKSFVLGCFSGLVEFAGALITLAISEKLYFAIPLLMSFSSGTMLSVVINHVITQCFTDRSRFRGNIYFLSGFLTMMILDNMF